MSDFKKQLQKLSEVASRKKAYAIAQSWLDQTGKPQALIVQNSEWFTISWAAWKSLKPSKLVSVIHRSQKWNA